MGITVQDVVCPVCGAQEVNEETGLLNIRGYKVGDRHGWWSHCLLDHGLRELDGREVEVKDLWFVHSQIAHKDLIEVNGKLYYIGD